MLLVLSLSNFFQSISYYANAHPWSSFHFPTKQEFSIVTSMPVDKIIYYESKKVLVGLLLFAM